MERMLEEHGASAADHSYKIWNLMCFELWMREVVDGSAG